MGRGSNNNAQAVSAERHPLAGRTRQKTQQYKRTSEYELQLSMQAHRSKYGADSIFICEDGSRTWKDEQGRCHRDDGPAEENKILEDGSIVSHWYYHGYHHREDGPAEVYVSGSGLNGEKEVWLTNDHRHRDNGPAVTYVDGSQDYYEFDKLHNDNGPARIFADGTKHWMQDNKLHRGEGPAIETPDGQGDEYYFAGFAKSKASVDILGKQFKGDSLRRIMSYGFVRGYDFSGDNGDIV